MEGLCYEKALQEADSIFAGICHGIFSIRRGPERKTGTSGIQYDYAWKVILVRWGCKDDLYIPGGNRSVCFRPEAV